VMQKPTDYGQPAHNCYYISRFLLEGDGLAWTDQWRASDVPICLIPYLPRATIRLDCRPPILAMTAWMMAVTRTPMASTLRTGPAWASWKTRMATGPAWPRPRKFRRQTKSCAPSAILVPRTTVTPTVTLTTVLPILALVPGAPGSASTHRTARDPEAQPVAHTQAWPGPMHSTGVHARGGGTVSGGHAVLI
jgi:hypothetical protein